MVRKTKSVVLQDFKQLLEAAYAPSTVDQYHWHTAQFLDFAKNVPGRVTNQDFLDYQIHIKDRSVQFRKAAICGVKSYFKLYLKTKVKELYCINPRTEKRIPKYLDFNTMYSRANRVKNTKHRICLLIPLLLGLRNAEVLRVQLKDIDVEKLTLLVRGKGLKQRLLPLPEELRDLLIVYVDEYNPERYLLNGQFEPQYSAHSLRNLVKRHLGDYKYHQLRHTFGQYQYETTGDIYYVSRMMGHSSVKTTERYYANPSLNHLREQYRYSQRNRSTHTTNFS